MTWGFFTCLLALPASGSPQSASSLVSQEPVTIEYVVDARDPGKKILLINARINGLPPGDVTLEFLDAKENLGSAGRRVGSLNLITANGETRRIRANMNQFNFHNSFSRAVEISYQLKSDALANLGKSTYLDERRCLLNSRDAFLVPKADNVGFKVSFVLPPKWAVATLATASVPDSYEVLSQKETFFYLGEATEFRERINNCAVSLAIEEAQPAASRDSWRQAKNQISYLQNLAADWKPRSLFIVFFNSILAGAKTPAVSLRNGNAIFLIPRESSERTEDIGGLNLQLSEKLVGYFFPAVHRLQEATIQESLIAYVAMKTCLKTGGMSSTEFLEEISRGLGEDVSCSNFGSAATLLELEPTSKPSSSRARQTFGLFVIDLVLAFQGRQSGTLIEVVQKLFQESRGTEADFLKELTAEGTVTLSDSLQLADLLKPFALVLRRIEVPSFSFDLSETFQVSRVGQRVNGRLSSLQLGDRILAINQSRLLEPLDFFKLRGILRAPEDVILTIERNGTTLRLKDKMIWTSYCQLTVNGLADADKRQKLDQFLARESLN
jgi:M61 glycyl aminopeptidase